MTDRERMLKALASYLKIKPDEINKQSANAILKRINSLAKQVREPTKKRTGGMDMMKKKGYARGGAKMKKMRAGGGKMPMAKDPKTGKMVPTFAMDGKGKMRAGGTMKKKGMARGGMKKMMNGGMMKKKGMARGGVKKMMGGGTMKKKGYARGGTTRRK